MKIIALTILSFLTLRQALRAMFIKKDVELDKLAFTLFPTVTMYLMALGVL